MHDSWAQRWHGTSTCLRPFTADTPRFQRSWDRSPHQANKEQVESEVQSVRRETAAARSIKEECEKDMGEAMPAVHNAEAKLKNLNASDVEVIRSLKKAPKGVKLVIHALCVLFEVPPDEPEKKPEVRAVLLQAAVRPSALPRSSLGDFPNRGFSL